MGHKDFENARRNMLPIPNETAAIQVLIASESHSLFLSLGPWRYKKRIKTPERKAVFVVVYKEQISCFCSAGFPAKILEWFTKTSTHFGPLESANLKHWLNQWLIEISSF
jgi:hypothetical protein